MSAFPPHRTIPSIPIPQEIALKFLSSYLEATKTSPHLLPNARLEASGPTAGSSASSVTIHNLQRVEAGLQGEWLAPTLDLEEGNVMVAEGMDDGTNKGQDVDEEGQGWMDLGEYQREQSIEGGEVGERIQGVAEKGDSDFENPGLGVGNEDEDEEGVKVPKAKKVKTKHDVPAAKVLKPKDKEARKREKKLRMKEEKKQRHEQKLKVAKFTDE
jgi:hypothetical protein